MRGSRWLRFLAPRPLYVIPKSNATIRGSYVWKDMIRDLISHPLLFLSEYFRRKHSESGFSADKRFDLCPKALIT